jgi:hypothetical protein
MLPLLFAARAGIILWVTVSVMPFELMFTAVEAAIDRELSTNPRVKEPA